MAAMLLFADAEYSSALELMRGTEDLLVVGLIARRCANKIARCNYCLFVERSGCEAGKRECSTVATIDVGGSDHHFVVSGEM